ncbi:MAG: DUF4240 domain-containing protein [Isosphaeraceae bacterium]
MDRPTFWKMIDRSHKQSDGDLDEQLELLRSQVETLEATEIVEFGRIFHEYEIKAYTWDLWAAAYIVGGGCSDDGFSDFRGWLISRGEKAYEAALRDPESLVQVVSDADQCLYEGFQYVASQAWENKTGKKAIEYPRYDLTHPTEPAGEPWSEDGDDLRQRFPKLWKRFSPPPPRQVQIIAAPPGEAPLSVREAWIGCILPLLPGASGPEPTTVRGVTSGVPKEPSLSFKVRALDAFSILERKDTEAANWWKEHTPQLLQPGKLLAFRAEVCELLPEQES